MTPDLRHIRANKMFITSTLKNDLCDDAYQSSCFYLVK